MKKVSIIVPIYNMERCLYNSLDSILASDYKDYELILVNDGSTDNSGQLCEDYKNANSTIDIKVIHKINGGLPSARNAGLEVASGKYVIYADPDDTIESNLLSENIPMMEKNNADLLIFGINCVYVKDKKIVNTSKRYCNSGIYSGKYDIINAIYDLIDNAVINPSWNKIYKNEILKNYNIVFPSYRNLEDSPYNYNYLYYVNKLIVNDKFYYNYYIYTDITTNSKIYIPNASEYYLGVTHHMKKLYDISDKKWKWQVYDILINWVISDLLNNLYHKKTVKTRQEKIAYIKQLYNNPDIKAGIKYLKINGMQDGISKLMLLFLKVKSVFFIMLLSRYYKHKKS